MLGCPGAGRRDTARVRSGGAARGPALRVHAVRALPVCRRRVARASATTGLPADQLVWTARWALPRCHRGRSTHGHVRELLWALAVACEFGGAWVGFATPGLGRSQTQEWTIDGAHFAERCQAFVLIALGESIVVSGYDAVRARPRPSVGDRLPSALARSVRQSRCGGCTSTRAAEPTARRVIAGVRTTRVGLGRSAFHWLHPLIVARRDRHCGGHPRDTRSPAGARLHEGGVADGRRYRGLFLGGHAVFKAAIWRRPSWPRILDVPVLLLLLLVAPHVTSIVLALPGAGDHPRGDRRRPRPARSSANAGEVGRRRRRPARRGGRTRRCRPLAAHRARSPACGSTEPACQRRRPPSARPARRCPRRGSNASSRLVTNVVWTSFTSPGLASA